jgi:DNA-binding transcriptional LysR family regulator
MQWTDRIGRRVKLRDIHVLLAVAQSGSMSKAAERLAVSHPVVSKTISDLEHALGVRLFDRSSHGVEPTPFGRAFLDCGVAVFDELRRGVGQIEYLSDPTAGQLRVGATEPIMNGLILAAMEQIVRRYPRIEFHNITGGSSMLSRALRERRVDLVVSRILRSLSDDDLVAEALFDEHLFVVAGLQNSLARRRKIELTELLDEPWAMPERDNAAGALIAEGFRSIGLAPLKSRVTSNSVAVRTRMVTESGFLTMLPGSMLHFCRDRLSLKALPVTLPMKSQPVEIVTLKDRTLSPVTKTFIECLRSVARPLAKSSR